VALPALRQAFAIPVVGVVPAVKPAAALSQRRVIGLLGTPGTVSALYTDDLVRRFAEDCRVIRVGSPALVALAEGLLAGCAPDPRQVAAELAPFFGAGEAAAPDVVVLACTHFPLLRAVLAEVAPPRVRFIDSGAAVARRVRDLLGEADDRPAVRGVAFFTAESETATAQSHAFRIRGFETPGLLEIA
jgi:glutamate racemase